MTREIQVDADWLPSGKPGFVGFAVHRGCSRQRDVFFAYDSNWLRTEQARNLDPDLQWFTGRQFPSAQKHQGFGIFLDSAPDRWGRVLMQRREAHLARIASRKPKKLLESDFLIGVHDEQRLGGMRLRFPGEDEYLSHDASDAAPLGHFLRELEQASWEIQSDQELSDTKTSEVLRLLVAPGSSLGVLVRRQGLWMS